MAHTAQLILAAALLLMVFPAVQPMTTDSSWDSSTDSGLGDGVTDQPGAEIECVLCEGANCTMENMTQSCNSTSGGCWLTFNEDNSTLTLGCEPIEPSTTCLDVYPAGTYTSSTCEFCCTSANCNDLDLALVQSSCQALSGATRLVTGVLVSLMFATATFFIM